MKQDASIGTNILRVSASDEDADNNGAIVYSISAPYNPQDMDYFEIQPESGWIVLKKPLDVSVVNLIPPIKSDSFHINKTNFVPDSLRKSISLIFYV